MLLLLLVRSLVGNARADVWGRERKKGMVRRRVMKERSLEDMVGAEVMV